MSNEVGEEQEEGEPTGGDALESARNINRRHIGSDRESITKVKKCLISQPHLPARGIGEY